jgi:peroxiredoxin
VEPAESTHRTSMPVWLRLLIVALVSVAGATVFVLGDGVPEPIARGLEAPAFKLPSLGGSGEVDLADLRGQVVLLNFWATWCKPCEEEMPSMNRLYRDLHGDGFEMLAISVDEKPEVVAKFRERLGLSFPILLDPDQFVTNQYQTAGFPESILLDVQGRIIERYVGPRDWDHKNFADRIRLLLNER